MLLERFRRYPDVTLRGIELDPEIATLARARGIDVEMQQISVFEEDQIAAALRYGDASIDVVLAAEIIEHIVDSAGFVREIARVLRPGGVVLLSTPNLLWWKYRVQMLAGRTPDLIEHRLHYGEDFGHVRTFTPDSLRELAEEAGLEVVRVAGKRLGPIASLTRSPAFVARALDELASRAPKL